MGLPRGWVCYNGWNEAIRHHLFDGRFAGRPVYLDTDDAFFHAAFAEVSRSCPHDVAEARASLFHSLDRTLEAPGSPHGPFHRHSGAAERWRQDFFERGQRDDTPSFLALLLVFVLVAEEIAVGGKFAANDYFGRLALTLSQALGTAYSKQEVQRSYYAHIDGQQKVLEHEYCLWDLLNFWIEAHGDELGIPTAYPVDGREYVSVPVGQALFRPADRMHLYGLFAQAFREYRTPSAEEMAEVLSMGLTSPPFSKALFNTWQAKANRKALVERAQAELESWDSTWEVEKLGGPSTTTSRALLKATLRERPRQVLFLSLTARASGSLVGTYRVPASADRLAHRCLRPEHPEVRLEPAVFGSRWVEFSPAEAVDVAEVLVRRLELEGPGRKLSRSYRAVNVMQLDPQEQIYIETDRAVVARPALVLASEGLAKATADVLEVIARPGWVRRDASTLRGVPPGWILFSNVEVVGQLPDEAPVADELAPLMLAERLDLGLVGGLTLPGGPRSRPEWHTHRPPEILVSHPDLHAQIRVTAMHGPELDTETVIGEPLGLGACPIPALLAIDGSLELRAVAADKEASARLRLRSSESPRPTETRGTLCVLGNADGTIDGVDIVDAPDGRRVTGAGAAFDDSIAPQPPSAGPPPREGSRWETVSIEERAAENEDPVIEERLPAELPGCVLRPGAHYWLLPTSKAQWVTGECKLCGLVQRHSNRYMSEERAARLRAATPTPTAIRSKARPGRLAGAPVSHGARGADVRRTIVERVRDLKMPQVESNDDWDLLLDALCAIGSGSWTSFVAVATQAVPDAHPQEVARVLGALGHIEIDMGAGDREPTRWSIAPAAVVVGAEHPFLCGRRSTGLLKALARAMQEKAGGDLVVEPLAGQPRRILLSGVGADSLDSVAKHVSEATETQLVYAGRASMRLLRKLPALAWLRTWLRETVLAPRFAETFDFKQGRWKPNDGMVQLGDALRTVEGRRLFGVADSVEVGRVTLRRGGYQLVKHLSGHILGIPLIEYDIQQHELSVPLGAELPWLYERVAVLCSGRRPSRLGARLHYGLVTEEVAQGLWDRLAPENRSPR